MWRQNNSGLDDDTLWDMAGKPGPISAENVGTGDNNTYLTEGLDISQIEVRDK